MKKVGIVSCYFKDNYGSLLQAYATKKILDNNNIPNETIAIEANKNFKKRKRKYYLSQIFNFSFIKSKLGMIKMKLDKKINKELGKNISIRNKKYKEFKKEFNLSRSCADYKGLTQLAKDKYSDIIVGSDQLWLPVNVVADYYTLNWVPDHINKISYATSFGVSNIPKKYDNIYIKFLKRINHLSVREESGKEILDKYKINSKVVCDPTILLTKEEWEKECTPNKFINKKYILCYFLGNNIEHRKFVERLKDKTGYKIVSLNHADEYVKYSDEFADITPYDVGPREWLNLVKNAEYVCTDSFHGTVFSIIFNKTFFDFRRFNPKNKNNTNSRLDSLLNIAGISKERILTGLENVDKVLKYEIDYKKVNENIDKFRNESKNWLLESITYTEEKTNDKFIKIEDKELCCGCTACYSICPKKAISMVEDEEGFLYPKVDKEKCINCGLCKKVCPVINYKEDKKNHQKAYIFQHQDNKIRKESTSGGAFTAIAEYVIKLNGVVFGVSLDEKFEAKHTHVNNIEKLEKFRNSKYVQSNPNNSFEEVKEFLKQGKLVLYSGTYCQIVGLKKYLNKEYENLILVDVVCRAVPSPLMWRKYLKMQEKKYKNPQKILFREKTYGYKYSNLSIYTKDKEYHKGIDSDQYLRAFFSNICDRPSCYNCQFKTQYRDSDLTIWDCFNVEKFNKNLDDDRGTTRILCHSEKGERIIKEISSKNTCEEISVDIALSDFNGIFSRVNYNSRKKEFVKDMNDLTEEELFNKYFPDDLKVKLERNARKILLKTGMYKKFLNVGKKIRKRD